MSDTHLEASPEQYTRLFGDAVGYMKQDSRYAALLAAPQVVLIIVRYGERIEQEQEDSALRKSFSSVLTNQQVDEFFIPFRCANL